MAKSKQQLEWEAPIKGFKYPGIEPKMVAYIDARLKDNGLFKHCVETKNFRGVMVMAAEACVGIKEHSGKNDGEWVNSIQRTVDGKVSDNEYWCMDFQMMLRAYATLKTGVKSPLKWTQSCASLWADTNKRFPNLIVKRIPLPGAIKINKHIPGGGGHTETVIACDGVYVYCIGGNSSGSLNPVKGVTGKIDRNGNGVYYTVQRMDDPEIVGFIKPVETDLNLP